MNDAYSMDTWQRRAIREEMRTGKRANIGAYCCRRRLSGPCDEHAGQISLDALLEALGLNGVEHLFFATPKPIESLDRSRELVP